MSGSKRERKVKVGVVGCGVVATTFYLPYLKEHADLVAVCDLCEKRASAAKRLFDAQKQYTDFDRMLDDPNVEAVFVLTGPGTHASFTAKAARAGKHVLVQKPMSTNIKDADDAVSAVRKAKVKALVEPSVSSLLNPVYPPIKDLIDKGVLGRPLWFVMGVGVDGRHVPSHVTGGAPPYGIKSFFSKDAGGPLFDMAYSPATIASLLGPVKSVTGLAKTSVRDRFISKDVDFTDYLSGFTDIEGLNYWTVARRAGKLTEPIKMEAEDNTFSLYEMANGALGCLVANWCTFHPSLPGTEPLGLQVFGLDGNLILGGGYFASFLSTKKDLLPKVDEDGWYHISRGEPWNYYHASAQHLMDCVLEDRDPIPNVEWGRHVSEMMIGAIESSRMGKKYVMTSTF